MSIAKYDKYKDSGVDWLGDIPEHWEVKRVKDLIFKIGSGVTPKGGSEVYVDEGIPFIRSQNVYDDGLWIDNVSFITEETNDKMLNSQIRPDDILINITGASIGRSCIVPETLKKANINQHIIYLRSKKRVVPFLSNYIKSSSIKGYIMLIQAGSSKEALNMGQTLNIPVLVPSYSEQTAIATYLDSKTSAIDRKVSLLEQKITHYQQLRKSLINETVCRGLDKNVKLKDSGIEFIGMIPEHWEVKRMKDVCGFINRGSSPNYDETGSYKVVNQATFSKGFWDESSLRFTQNFEVKPRGLLKEDDILIASTGGGVLGKVYFFNRKESDYIADSHVTILRDTRKSYFSKYVYYYFSEKFKLINDILAQGSTNQTELQRDWLLAFFICIPPQAEQISIATFLDEKTQKIDSIVSNIKTQIETLKELRKTLINDVVTGKIKVSS